MSLVVNTNISSLLAQRKLSLNSKTLQGAMERLSSGYRINRAADDAAGLTISQNLVSQIKRMNQASRNTLDGISVLQVTEGGLEAINDNLQRVRELTVQAANDTNDASMRTSISNEVKSLLSEVDRIASATNLNGINLLDGTASNALVQVGVNSNTITNTVDLTSVLTDASSTAIGVVGAAPKTFANIAAISLSSNTLARTFLTDIDSAIRTVNIQRASIGSFQNKLESVDNSLSEAIENFSASNSRIRDADIAAESSTMTQAQIMTQAATSVLAQTNELPRMILNLLQRN